MKRLVESLAILVLAYVAIFHVGQESLEAIGWAPVLVLLGFGFVMWTLLNMLSMPSVKSSARSINWALWLHSALEGALTAISFSFGMRAGLIVTAAMALHLLPEGLAAIALLKQSGSSTAYAIKSYLISVGLLIVSLGFFSLLPSPSEQLLIYLSTIIAGGFIYVALASVRKLLQPNT